MKKNVLLIAAAFCLFTTNIFAQHNHKKNRGVTPVPSYQNATDQNKFRQLDQDLPTPNVYRTASGAPGHQYWQNTADYTMDIRLDDENQRVYGTEEITYNKRRQMY